MADVNEDIAFFTVQDGERLAATVRKVEGMFNQLLVARRPPLGSGTTQKLMIASGDIDHRGTGQAKLAESTGDDWTDSLEATGDDLEVANPICQKLWKGCYFLAEQISLPKADKRYVATSAFSATRIFGTLGEKAGSVWDFRVSFPIDGHYDKEEPDRDVVKAKVYMSEAEAELKAGIPAFAMHDSKNNNSEAEWIIYSIDCLEGE